MSSEIEEVLNMSDKIIILKEGKIAGTFMAREIDKAKMQIYM